MKAQVFVTLKSGVLDPQGDAVKNALHSMNYQTVNSVRQGKYFELDLKTDSIDKALNQINEMCEKLLANTVIENYQVKVLE